MKYEDHLEKLRELWRNSHWEAMAQYYQKNKKHLTAGKRLEIEKAINQKYKHEEIVDYACRIFKGRVVNK